MSPNDELFTNSKTGRVWYAGEDIPCLATELKITPDDAESFLSYGMNAGQILLLLGTPDLWRKIRGSNNRVAFMKGCIKNQAARTTTPASQPGVTQAASPDLRAPDTPAVAPKARLASNELFVNSKSGRVWHVGEDIACLTEELKISPADAESYLAFGLDAGKILAFLARVAECEANREYEEF
jgi:hypothetical protein